MPRISLSYAIAIIAILLGTVTLPVVAQAQDRFITTSTVDPSPAAGVNIFVGKDNGTNFNTLPDTPHITYTLTGSYFPNGAFSVYGNVGYNGLNVFGTHSADIQGDTQVLIGWENSKSTISGGFVQNGSAFDTALLTLNTGTLNNGTTGLNGQIVQNGGQSNFVRSFGTSNVTINSGNAAQLIGNDNSTITVNGGIVDTVTVNASSKVTQNGGTVNTLLGSGTYISHGGTVTQATFTGASNVTLNNTAINSLAIEDSSIVVVDTPIISGNTISTYSVAGAGQLTTKNAGGSYKGRGNAKLTVQSAQIIANQTAQRYSFDLGGRSSALIDVDIPGDTITVLILSEQTTARIMHGVVSDMQLKDLARADFIFGFVDKALVSGSAEFFLKGGHINEVTIQDVASFTWNQGEISRNTIRLIGNGVLNITATNFSFSLIGTGSDSMGSYTQYLISGTLRDGSTFTDISVLDYDGGFSIGDPLLGGANNGNIRILSVAPEPSTLALLGVGIVGMVVRRRRRK